MSCPGKFRKAAIEAGKSGFTHKMERHYACFYRRSDTLVVTFDHKGSRSRPAPRYPWGHALLKSMGHSHLGIMMSGRNDWFRHKDLFDFFDKLRDEGFFKGFRKVLFYGLSMGGYGALAFVSAAPGADVMALMPQSTLAPDLVPFERRYRKPRLRGDWDDPRYRDGAVGVAAARNAYLFYDPYFPLDHLHAQRITGDNVHHMKCFRANHFVGSMLMATELLKPSLEAVLDGTISNTSFQSAYRERRHQNPAYMRRLNKAAKRRGHPKFAQICRAHRRELVRAA